MINSSKIPFSFTEASAQLEPLLILIGGITIYGVFIFKFYRFLARKNIFHLNLQQYNQFAFPRFQKFMAIIYNFLEYLLIFPLFILLWTLILTTFLALISKADFQFTLMAAMAMIASTRITAYYNEDLSKDLAKMVPFALLGIMLVDYTFIRIEDVFSIFFSIFSSWKLSAYYLMLTIVLELALRIITSGYKMWKAKKTLE